VLADRLAEGLVCGYVSLVERVEITVYETGALRFGDPKVAVDGDKVRESELPAEPVRDAERPAVKPETHRGSASGAW
jgi:hypothetical protein